jgi:hemoglobin
MNIYNKIGPERLGSIIRDFYGKAFVDPMLAHFFWNFDQQHLVTMQVDFATSMLGGPQNYRGKSLAQAHGALQMRPPHFHRRQKILKETMVEHGLEDELIQAWLNHEERLKPLIMQDQSSCAAHPEAKK